MKSQEIRQRFLDFFEANDHTVVPSAPLVPDDATLLFTNAGMVPFKDTFLGDEQRGYLRAASSQKCMRVSGKHNDLENVGPSPRHHTFFEMLGNFSFGDYFKEEAIHLAWRFLTEELAIPAERMAVSVHHGDDEAYRIWTEEIGLGPDRVVRLGNKTNFWMMADVGPCGPNSEIFVDLGPEYGPEYGEGDDTDFQRILKDDHDRCLEIWNLVFMQFDQAPDGSRKPLPQTGVDTGMGLERVTAVLQGVEANYDTDLFTPIMEHVQAVLGQDDATRKANEVAYRVLADHGRAMTFLVADGVTPGNAGRGYVLRLIMRRAMRFGKMIGVEEPILAGICDVVIEGMKAAYPNLEERRAWIREVVEEEEARFERTLDTGLGILDERIAELRKAGASTIPGEDVFKLYDTFGFPPDLTRIVAEESGMRIDMPGFEQAMQAQREKAQAAGRFKVGSQALAYRGLEVEETRFLGYEQLECEARVLALHRRGDDGELEAVDHARIGDEVEIVLDQTPFYAEAGGQIGDVGFIEGPAGRVEIRATHKPMAGLYAHSGRVATGRIERGQTVTAGVDREVRADIMRNHTATHLLHRVLQTTLGEHAQQRGSLVAPDRLRFDFAHLKGLEADELAFIEAQVNAMVRADSEVSWSEMPIDDARRAGAMMLFGEKYGDVVRVVDIDGVSKELCGGTHLNRTGEIGGFVITGESSVGAGIRRLEALTGRGASAFVRERLSKLEDLAARLGTPSVDDVEVRIEDLKERNRELARELESARAQLASAGAGSLLDRVVDVDGVAVLAGKIDAADADALRGQIDVLRDRMGSGVIVLGSVIDGTPRLVAGVTDDLVQRGLHAGKLVKAVASALGGGGGGRPNLAEAGGRDAAGLDAALADVPDHVRAMR